MTISKTLRIFVVIILAAGMFAAGYFWAMKSMEHGCRAAKMQRR